MNLWTPNADPAPLWLPGGDLSDMTPAERAEADAVAKAFVEVQGYLKTGDADGADAYLEEFLRGHGQLAHDTVLNLVQLATKSPDWRTFGSA